MPRRPDTAPLALLKARLEEAGSRLHRPRGAAGLARLLAAAGEPLWLEDHPWLRPVAPKLEQLGVKPLFAAAALAPEAETVVTVGWGAIPETGSVLVAADTAAAALLPLRARRQVVLVPRSRANLSLAQALRLMRQADHLQVTWLTGPSRTADIEKVLVLGAQGPAALEVVLYDGPEPQAGLEPQGAEGP